MVIGSSTARLPDPDGYAPKDSLHYSSTATSPLTAFTTAPLGTIPILGEELDPTRYRLDKPALELVNHANVFCREGLDIGTRAFLPHLPKALGALRVLRGEAAKSYSETIQN